jgi:nucleotide-binding universal stress UspA family protein
MNTETLLVAIDPHAHASEIVGEASALAAKLGAELVLLHVFPVKPSVDLDVLVHPEAHPAAAVAMRDEERAVLPSLRELAADATSKRVRARLRIAHGDVVQAILEVASDVGAGLIVLGTHGRRGISRLALGSVAESVLRESPVPVLALRGGRGPTHGRVVHHEVPLDGAAVTEAKD